MTRIHRSLLLVLSLQAAFAQASGRTVGNGGDVVLCKDVGGQRPIELLDFYEGRTLRGIQPDLGLPSLSITEKIEIALTRLDRVSPSRARRYREHVANFLSEALFLKDAHLIDIPDSDHIAIPQGCRIEQIANQSKPLYPEDKRFIIDQNLWDRLGSDDHAGLILHEVIYREAIEMGHQNSVSVRILTSNITSRKIEEMSVERFTRFLGELGFASTSVQGVEIQLLEPNTGHRTRSEFYPNGNLKSASAVPGSAYFWRDQKLTLRDQVAFFPSGQIQKLILAAPTSLTLQGDTRRVSPYEIGFFENGEVESISFEAPTRFSSSTYELSLSGAARFHLDGTLALGRIDHGWISVQSQKALIEGVAEFFPQGRLKSAILASPIALPSAQGSNPRLLWHASIELNDRGEVFFGVLAEDQALSIAGRRLPFSRWYPVSFFPESGALKRGCIQERATLLAPDGSRTAIDARSVIELTEDGKLARVSGNC